MLRSKSTLLLVAIGCLGWYAANREAIEAQSKGEAGTYDLWWPFIIWFGLAALVRAIYRQISDKTNAEKPKSKPLTTPKESEKPFASDPVEAPSAPPPVEAPPTSHLHDSAADTDPEVLKLREQLAAAENEAAERNRAAELEQQRSEKADLVERLSRELAEAEARLNELKNDGQDS